MNMTQSEVGYERREEKIIEYIIFYSLYNAGQSIENIIIYVQSQNTNISEKMIQNQLSSLMSDGYIIKCFENIYSLTNEGKFLKAEMEGHKINFWFYKWILWFTFFCQKYIILYTIKNNFKYKEWIKQE